MTTPIYYFSSQRRNAGALKTVETSPPVAPRSNPNAPVLNKEDLERLETPHGLLLQLASEVTVFNQPEKIARWMPIRLGLLYPLSHLASTPKGDNRVEEQGLNSLLVNFRGKF